VHPRTREQTVLNAERWRSFPASVRTAQQVAGRAFVSCGATHGVMERCDFGCTSCYLTPEANKTPALPFAEVARQLEALRETLGPAGKVQITAGEVTLLPLEQLGRIVDHARAIGLDPMVMSHGQRFAEEPEYLERLVRDHRLEKIAIHIDSTQRGRHGVPAGSDERQLDSVRDRFAGLIRRTRTRTRRRLYAAHTITVTPETLEQIPRTMQWMLANADAFRMVSFQPVADVGRTRDRRDGGLGLDAVWSTICEGVGQPLNRDAMHFGHRECSIVCPLIVVSFDRRRLVLESARAGRRWDARVMQGVIRRFGGFSTRGRSTLSSAARALALLLRSPLFLVEFLAYAIYRAWSERGALLRAMLSGLLGRGLRIRPLAIVVHRFMDGAELHTALGRERLDACVFKLPVDGRMVSMCEMNATELRRNQNLAATAFSER
jgi:hypothetical protein